jgi:hypothetical protein
MASMMNLPVIHMPAISNSVYVEATTVTELMLADNLVCYTRAHELRPAKAALEVAGSTGIVAGMGNMPASSEATNTLRVIPGRGKISYERLKPSS